MNFFTASDVFQFAIRIEEDGRLFYQKAAVIADNESVSHLFNRLADAEFEHKNIFKTMLNEVGDFRPPESYQGEYMRYLHDYIDGRAVFTRDLGKTLEEIHDVVSAIDFALQRELDSIVYYQELKNFVPEKNHKQIDKIVDEERKHFSTLSELKKTFLRT